MMMHACSVSNTKNTVAGSTKYTGEHEVHTTPYHHQSTCAHTSTKNVWEGFIGHPFHSCYNNIPVHLGTHMANAEGSPMTGQVMRVILGHTSTPMPSRQTSLPGCSPPCPAPPLPHTIKHLHPAPSADRTLLAYPAAQAMDGCRHGPWPVSYFLPHRLWLWCGLWLCTCTPAWRADKWPPPPPPLPPGGVIQ